MSLLKYQNVVDFTRSINRSESFGNPYTIWAGESGENGALEMGSNAPTEKSLFLKALAQRLGDISNGGKEKINPEALD